MAQTPKVGEGEWYVMKALWAQSPLSGSDIVKAVSRETDWSQSTILTMLRRLVAKKAVGARQEQVMMYFPLLDENEVKRAETSQFVRRVYEGSANLMLRSFIEAGELSEQEREALRKLLDEMR